METSQSDHIVANFQTLISELEGYISYLKAALNTKEKIASFLHNKRTPNTPFHCTPILERVANESLSVVENALQKLDKRVLPSVSLIQDQLYLIPTIMKDMVDMQPKGTPLPESFLPRIDQHYPQQPNPEPKPRE